MDSLHGHVMGDQFCSLSESSSTDQSSCVLDSSGDIPPEDWAHARALIEKYPPQIILWMVREVLSKDPTIPTAASFNRPSTSSNLNYINGLLRDDKLRVSTATRSPMGDNPNLETGTGPLDGQGPPNIPPTQSCVLARSPDRKQEGLKKEEKRLFCVFDEHRNTSFGKPGDWRRHMNNFHEPGKKAWRCPEEDCHQIFDTPTNFCQHHRKKHKCRKSCNHAERAKMRIPMKRAFACGYQSCTGLLFSWDKWCDHIAQHMENGMTIDQWQYNTLLRNLLRRQEVHLRWEELVAQQLFPYNVPPRFSWRPRNTREVKWQLEYLEDSELLKNAASLVLRAYDIGLAVRSGQELLGPSIPIAEPITTRRKSHDLSSLGIGDSDHPFGDSAFPFPPQKPQAFQLPLQHSTPTFSYDLEHLGSNGDTEYFANLDRFSPPFDFEHSTPWS